MAGSRVPYGQTRAVRVRAANSVALEEFPNWVYFCALCTERGELGSVFAVSRVYGFALLPRDVGCAVHGLFPAPGRLLAP